MASANGLPEMCWVVNEATKHPVIVRRGVTGFYPSEYEFANVDAEAFVAEQNRRLGITDPQMRAMKAGSIFGFDKPIADPKHWELG